VTRHLRVVRTGFWFIACGAFTLVRAAVELTEPVYYDPVSLLDYTAVVLTSAASGALAVALYSWWRTAPFGRLSIVLLVAAIATAAESLGNLLEDGFDSEFGASLYTSGGLTGAVALMVTAVVALATASPVRWSGLFLLAGLGGAIFPDDGGLWLTGASFLGLGVWMIRRPAYERATDERIR
jgi:hypothetical protein